MTKKSVDDQSALGANGYELAFTPGLTAAGIPSAVVACALNGGFGLNHAQMGGGEPFSWRRENGNKS